MDDQARQADRLAVVAGSVAVYLLQLHRLYLWDAVWLDDSGFYPDSVVERLCDGNAGQGNCLG